MNMIFIISSIELVDSMSKILKHLNLHSTQFVLVIQANDSMIPNDPTSHFQKIRLIPSKSIFKIFMTVMVSVDLIKKIGQKWQVFTFNRP